MMSSKNQYGRGDGLGKRNELRPASKPAFKRLTFWLCQFLICGGGVFCAGKEANLEALINEQQVSEEAFLSLKDGASFNEVLKTLGSAARHEFTILNTNVTCTLIGCYVGRHKVFQWLLFNNDVLVKRPPWIWCKEKSDLPDGDMARVWKVIDARSKTMEEIKSDFAPLPYDKRTAGEPMNILPALILTWPLMKMAEPRLKRKFLINRDLRKRFDGCLARSGMTVEQVDAIYGKPQRVVFAKDGRPVRIYGDGRDLEEIGRECRFSFVSVVFDANGRVMRVFSDMFFDDDWKQPVETENL